MNKTGSTPPSPSTVDPAEVIEDQALDAVAWMSALMRARMLGNFHEAEKAKGRLHDLGVVVLFRRGPKLGRRARHEEAAHDA